MNPNTLLADPESLEIEKFISEENSITIVVHSILPTASCTNCHQFSGSLKTRYLRSVADLPWHGVKIKLLLKVRKFRCRNDLCIRKVFCERLPKVVAKYARRTFRLDEVISLLAFALGGRKGAKTSQKLNIPVGKDTLLRTIRHQPKPDFTKVKVLGVDDFAFRKGNTYGTILVDLEQRKPIDLLPDRESETLALWLKQHPEVEIISRDRAGAYAEGAKTGAPQAKQVADRWHLLKNLGEAIERALQNYSSVISQAAQIVRQQQICQTKCLIEVGERSMLSSRQLSAESSTDNLRLARFREVHQLSKNGHSISQIGKRLKMSRMTVSRYLRFEEFPARAKTSERGSKLKPFLNYLHQRFAEGCQNATQLWREIVEQGYQGKSAMVRRYIKNLRKRISQVESKDYKNKQLETSFTTLSIRQTAILLLNKEDNLKAEEKIFVETILKSSEEVKKISQIGTEFQTMIKEKQSEKFNSWLENSKNCGIKELARFAFGLKQDEAAVRQSMSSEWSNGQVEGQVNRLKSIKRQMYGRANFDLLKARVMYQN